VLAETIRSGGTQAELVRESADGQTEIIEPSVRVNGSGMSTSGPVELDVLTVPGAPLGAPIGSDDGTLTGTWGGLDVPVLLAVARRQ